MLFIVIFVVFSFVPCHFPCVTAAQSDALLITTTTQVIHVTLSKTFDKLELPISDPYDIVAIDYDVKRNTIYWSNRESEIRRQSISALSTNSNLTDFQQILQQSNGDDMITSLAFDWTSELLYYTKKSSIWVMGTSEKASSFLRELIRSQDHFMPSRLLIHPGRGYLFWLSTDGKLVRFNRANLDGNDAKILFETPTAIQTFAIDLSTEEIVWTEEKPRLTRSCDFDGVISQLLVKDSPIELCAVDNRVFYCQSRDSPNFLQKIDTRDNADEFSTLLPVVAILSALRSIKFVSKAASNATNACSDERAASCLYACINLPNNGNKCLSPDSWSNDSDDTEAQPEQENEICLKGEFECTLSKECLADFLVCDGHPDCSDGSDENECTPCPRNLHQCQVDGSCISR